MDINEKIARIRELMKYEYRSEYSSLLQKMFRCCNAVKEYEENQNGKRIDVPKSIFESNFIRFFQDNGLNFDSLYIEPMSFQEKELYAKIFQPTL